MADIQQGAIVEHASFLGRGQSTEKKMYNLKVETYVLFGGIYEDFMPGRWDPQVSLRDLFEEVKEEPGYRGVFVMKTR